MKKTVTEEYLKKNYATYIEEHVGDKSYEEWKEWFLKTFNVEVAK